MSGTGPGHEQTDFGGTNMNGKIPVAAKVLASVVLTVVLFVGGGWWINSQIERATAELRANTGSDSRVLEELRDLGAKLDWNSQALTGLTQRVDELEEKPTLPSSEPDRIDRMAAIAEDIKATKAAIETLKDAVGNGEPPEHNPPPPDQAFVPHRVDPIVYSSRVDDLYTRVRKVEARVEAFTDRWTDVHNGLMEYTVGSVKRLNEALDKKADKPIVQYRGRSGSLYTR
jgi:hypothetical protein